MSLKEKKSNIQRKMNKGGLVAKKVMFLFEHN